MLDKLKAVEERYGELERRMQEPEVYTDPALYARLAREQKEIFPVVEAYRRYGKAKSDAEGAEALLGDPDLREMAKEELERARAEMEKTAEELKLLLLPSDPNDSKNVVMEIREGTGGEEAALFAGDLFRMYGMYADRKGWKLEIVNVNETELGGIKEVSFLIEGEGAYSRLKFESGGHRVQRVPVTESSGRIQTSAATVAVLPEVEDVEFDIDPKDLQIDTFRSSGAGGQHVNKTESAIRITHLPTGVVVECQDERSQYKNKDRAMKILRSKLCEAEREKQNTAIAAERKSQVGSGDRSERVRTYNFPQNRVTDHRLSGDVKNFNIAAIINGDLDELIDALVTADQAEKLRAQAEER
ncbi:MAG: peptide chain release factor 1 [Oscillospiraceae bacterium]|nr:peptide chain release factor 1 [Oscillospiraceae bacterium]